MPYSLKKKQTILHRIGKHMLLNDHSTMLSFCFTADDRSLTCLFLYLHFAKLLCQLRATARALTPAFGDWTTTTTVKNGHFKISSGPLASHSISFSVYNNQNLKIELIPGGRRRTSSVYAFFILHSFIKSPRRVLHKSFV